MFRSASSDLVLHAQAVSISSKLSTQVSKFFRAFPRTLSDPDAASAREIIAAVNAQWTVEIGIQR
jgi:hypothetical protein